MISRRRFLTLAGAAAAVPFLARVGASVPPSLDPILDAKGLAKSINRFGFELANRLTQDDHNTQFLSPFSIETALAMTAAGARGETFAEMKKTLHLPDDAHTAFDQLLTHLNSAGRDRLRPYELSTANAIWAMKGYPWHKEFIELTRKHYGAGLVEVDFGESEAARKRINAWVEKETREKIKDLIPAGAITALTRMVLANAIYFKGNWQYQFDKKYTRDAAFTRPDNSKVDVPLMHQTREFGYGEFTMFVRRAGESVQMLELPYAGRELSMLIYLPQDPTGAERVTQWLVDGNLERSPLKTKRVKVWLPRFKAESRYLLNQPLQDLGMERAFGGADFTGMSPRGKDLSISQVFHKAFVDVNEEGTEAAAATAVVLKEAAAPVEDPLFRADRPFVFVIRDNKTGTALFLGRYTGPVGAPAGELGPYKLGPKK
jgi:serpin B